VAPDGSIVGRPDIDTCPLDQMGPEIAFNGRDYLVAWTDRRPSASQIYFAQVTPGGGVRNDTGVWLSGRDSSVYSTLSSVASNGEGYLVTWLGKRTRGNAVLGARIAAAGEVLDTIPLEFSPDTLLLDRQAAGSDGQSYLIVWDGEAANDSGSDLCGRRLSAYGRILDSTPILIARSANGISNAQVAFGNGCYLVVWNSNEDDPNVYGCRVLPDGEVLDPNGVPICTDSGFQAAPSVASDGERFLVAWGDNRSGDYDVHAAFVDASGAVGLRTEFPRPAMSRPVIQIAPDPFRYAAVLTFSTSADGPVELGVYDAQGRLVRWLIDARLPRGRHEAIWNGRDRNGRALPGGTYFCRLRTVAGTATGRMTRLPLAGR
jgi:hypothetical protein